MELCLAVKGAAILASPSFTICHKSAFMNNLLKEDATDPTWACSASSISFSIF